MMSESQDANAEDEADRLEPIDQPHRHSEPETSTDRLEGQYTEVDGQAAHERTVAGEYTRTDGHPDEERTVGDYTSTDRHPETHDPSERHGKFVRSQPPKPHPGSHHAEEHEQD